MTAPARSSWTIPLADGPMSKTGDRVLAVVVAVTSIAIAIALWQVKPDARGHGTHEQLGMEECGWPKVYGIPCPTCGCTTAATQIVHGDWLSAFVTQPFGAALALMGLLAGLHALLCLVRVRSFADMLIRLPFWKIVFWMFVLLLLSWGYKYLVWEG